MIAAAATLVNRLVGNRIEAIKTPCLDVSVSAATVTPSANIPTDEHNTVAASGGPDHILVMGHDFVALVADEQLSHVVDRCGLALVVATSSLEQQRLGRAR